MICRSTSTSTATYPADADAAITLFKEGKNVAHIMFTASHRSLNY